LVAGKIKSMNNEEVNEETVEDIEEYHAKGTLQK
jgi:hypothetical protein